MGELPKLGRTGLPVSRIGLGLAALGRPAYINLGHADDLQRRYDVEAMEAHTHTVLDAAWEAGIRYFDVARSYGRAEGFLGSWLRARRIAPQAVTVGSKWGYIYTADWQVVARQHEVKDHSLAVLARQIGESRSLLGDHLDLYQIHSASLDSGVLDRPEVIDELARLRASGLRIGLTLTGEGQRATLQRALSVLVMGQPLFDTVQATWNLLEPSVGPLLQQAHAAGLGIIVKEALANGRLTTRNTDPAFATSRQRLEPVAGRLSASVDALALAAALAQPWADVVLSGAASVAQLGSNLEALDVRVDDAAIEQLTALAESPPSYWRTRAQLPWN